MLFMSDTHSFIDTVLQKLVQINSVNPSLESQGGGEKEIGTFIAQILTELQIEPIIHEIEPGRINVTGIIRGTGGGKSLILNAHTDTVGVAGMKSPFSGEIVNGKLFGRGAYDMKGSIASILGTAKKLATEKHTLKGDVLLSFVADEEFASIGASDFIKHFTADAAIVTEPTDLQVCLAHRGFGVFKITTHGKTAHGGKHNLGVDANMKMGKLLAALETYANRLPQQNKHALCGEASMHVPLIQGGNSLFIYSNSCTIHLERRTLPGETKQTVTNELERIIQKIKKDDPHFNTDLECLIWRSPYEIKAESSIVKALSTSAESVLGLPADYIGHQWWEDSAIFGQAGIETVVMGPKGGGIHEADEWVELESVHKLTDILYETSCTFCQ